MARRSPRFTGFVRAGRGATLGGALLVLTCAGHAAGQGGALPAPYSLVILAPLAFALGIAFAERRRTTLGLFAFLLAVEALFHVLLSVVGGHHSGASATVHGVDTQAMLAGHVLAALVFAAVLGYGDDLLHRWLAFLGDLARSAPRLSPAWTARTAPPVGVSASPLRSSTILRSVRRRGPPAFA